MRTLNRFLLGLLMHLPLSGAAQNQNAVWLFDMTTGLDFMTNPPTVLHVSTALGRNVSVIGSDAGDLVLYADEERIRNAQHQVLMNGDGLYESPFTGKPQSNMILPWPGHPGQYYMIQPYPWNLNDPIAPTYYHRVDMNAFGGSGAVVEKNVVLADSAGAYLTAVLDSAGTGIWVILHHLNAPRFMAYHLDADGLSTAPVISEAGPPIDPGWYQAMGILRPSPEGDRLYLSKCYENCVDFTKLHKMDFDRATGQISNFSTFDGPVQGSSGLEISPSGQYLYSTTYICASSIASQLWQYDVSSDDPYAILASKTLVHEATYPPGPCLGRQGNLALGVDGRIYCAVSYAQHLGVINAPDLPAPACDYVHQGFYLDGDTTWLGLPNQMRAYPITSTGMASTTAEVPRLLIVPHPATAGCRIVLGTERAHRLDLLDARGHRVRALRCAPGQRELQLDREGLANGLYLVVARQADGKVAAVGRAIFE